VLVRNSRRDWCGVRDDTSYLPPRWINGPPLPGCGFCEPSNGDSAEAGEPISRFHASHCTVLAALHGATPTVNQPHGDSSDGMLDMHDTNPGKMWTAFLPCRCGAASVQCFKLMCYSVPSSHLFGVYSVAASGQDMALQAIAHC
jgi:hypothetical protein